jgi:hypothetical protein
MHSARASEKDERGGEKTRKEDLVGNTLEKTRTVQLGESEFGDE